MVAAEKALMLDGGDGVRLVGHLSRPSSNPLGTVVFFHGWEGSSRSNYVMSAGARLFEAGFQVLRFNFRDHGDTHELNPGIFHSCRLSEVIHALADFQDREAVTEWSLAGYSLGGNFALRVARRGPAQGLRLDRVFSVCPVIDPHSALSAMESGPKFYNDYYIRKWARSVRIKQRLFPDLYDYEEWFELEGLRARTEWFATRYYDFGSLDDYLEGYSVAGDRLVGLDVPTVLLTSEDDPVIPAADARALPDIDALDVQVTRYGGHCGYLKNWRLESWAEDRLFDYFTGDRTERRDESGAGDGNRTHVISLGS
ncbi:alpha/beta fold hydrolase [Marinihelvus fidelis]|uniref:Alpha/beta fold hydrolase n=1 Tax=Marinihelvus fidelis TaxID=2613842 RepID=A0A5N0TA99_9GAMM|nr:alpha/beta fold hydrolase [Marinihelvus fidelis]